MRSAVVGDFLTDFLDDYDDVIHVFDDRGRLIFRGLACHDFFVEHFWYFVREFQWKAPGLAYIYLTGEVSRCPEITDLFS